MHIVRNLYQKEIKLKKQHTLIVTIFILNIFFTLTDTVSFRSALQPSICVSTFWCGNFTTL